MRPLGLVLGASAAFSLINIHRVPGGSGAPGAHVSVVARSLGEFTLNPVLPFLVSRSLSPGGEGIVGNVSLSNISPKAHLVRIKPVISLHDLDHLLQISVEIGSQVLFKGVLAELEEKVTSFTMGIAEKKDLRFRVFLPTTSERSVLGRSVDIEINFNIEKSGSGIEDLS